MLKFLAGPALLAAAYFAGSIYGASAEQLVAKPPGTVYSAVHRAIAANARSGTLRLEGGQPLPYELKLDQIVDEHITARLIIDGAPAVSAGIDFAPRDGGQATLMILRVDAEQSVLRRSLAGTSKAKLGYAPDWMLNIAARRILRDLAAGIEGKGTAGDLAAGSLAAA